MDAILDSLGFSDYKKKAYLALIRLEQASVGQIAKKANIPSSKVYETLKWLYENGYITLVSQKPLIYKANNAKAILKSEVRDRISRLRDIEDEIKHLKMPLEYTQKANFQIVYGRDSFFKKVKESVQYSRKSIVAIVKSWRLDYEIRELTLRFTQAGGEARFLGPINKENRRLVEEWKKIGVQVKHYVPESTRFTIWDSAIIVLGIKEESAKDYFSLWLENEYLGKVLVEHFNRLWNSL